MKTDILIIGGGAIGVSVAYFIKTMDASVEVNVVERDPTYEKASTPRASGGVRRLFSLEENIALSNFSIPFFENYPEIMSVDGEKAEIAFKKNGYIFIVLPEECAMLRENYQTQKENGVHVIWLEPEDIKQRFPSMNIVDLGAAVLSPDDGWLDPYSVLQATRKKAIALGVNFIEDEVINLARESNKVTQAGLKSGENIKAEHFVNAAGAWAKELCTMLGFSVPIEPLRRFEHYFECEEDIEPLPYLKDVARLAFRPEGKGYSGGVPTLKEPRGYNMAADYHYFAEVVWPALAHRFPQFERTKEKAILPGLYDQNDFDGNLIIGAGADGLHNFHLLAGLSGHGLMHAPGLGRAMAESLLHGRYETIDLNRFGWQRIIDNKPLPEKGII